MNKTLRDWGVIALVMAGLFITGKKSAIIWHPNITVVAFLAVSLLLVLYFEWSQRSVDKNNEKQAGDD